MCSKNSFVLISVDIECTGLSKFSDTTVELGADLLLVEECKEGGLKLVKVLPTFQMYSCGRENIKMHPEAAKVTKLDQCFLDQQPGICSMFESFIEHVDTSCREYAESERLLIAYNGNRFDIPILVADAEACYPGGAIAAFRKLRIGRVVDILHLAKDCLDPTKLKRNKRGACSYKLGDVYQALMKKPLVGAHGAVADAEAVSQLVMKCQELNHKLAGICCSSTTTEENRPEGSIEDSQYLSMMNLVMTSVKNLNEQKKQSGKRKKVDVLQQLARKKLKCNNNNT